MVEGGGAVAVADVVTWTQMAWVLGGMASVGVLLFTLNWQQNRKISEMLVSAEKGLSEAVNHLSSVVSEFQVEVAKERASNKYVEEVRAEMVREHDQLWSQVNKLRDRMPEKQQCMSSN